MLIICIFMLLTIAVTSAESPRLFPGWEAQLNGLSLTIRMKSDELKYGSYTPVTYANHLHVYSALCSRNPALISIAKEQGGSLSSASLSATPSSPGGAHLPAPHLG